MRALTLLLTVSRVHSPHRLVWRGTDPRVSSLVLLLLLGLLHGTSTVAQDFAQTAGSPRKTDLVEQTEDKSGKAQLKAEDKRVTASNAAKSVQHPKDVTASGKAFLDGCSSIDKPAKQLNSYETHAIVQCQSYVDGIFETMSLAENLHLKPLGFCAPEQPVQRNELVQIVRKYVADHPETSTERTVILAWLAFSRAYPCNKGQTLGNESGKARPAGSNEPSR